MSQSNHNNRPQEEEIDLREELERYLKHWPWFVLGVLVCVVLAFTYLKVTTPTYHTLASIIIKDEKGKSPSSEMAAFADLGLLGGMGAASIENEIGILRSKRMMTNVVKALNLNVTYFNEDAIKSPELYRNTPYFVQVLKMEEKALSQFSREAGNNFRFIKGTGNEFQLINTETEEVYKGKIGQPMEIPFADIILVENTEYGLGEDPDFPELVIKFSNIESVVSNYRSKLQINLTDKNSSLIELGLDDSVKEKAQDILDQLIFEYNQEAIEDKNLVARNTATFIDERLQIINEELDSVETGKEEFKEANQLTNIEAESEMFIENVSDYNKKEQEIGTQLELANTMISYLKSDSGSDLLPANLGIQEQSVNASIEEYNNLVLERNRILSGSTEKNPVVKRLNSQIEQIRGNVLASFERLRSNLQVSQQELEKQGSVINSKISAVPAKERQYRGIERQQNIKESLYLFLLQKREENSLSLAVTAPKAKIVDRAYSSVGAVSPKPKIILLAAFILGLLIPFLAIYLKTLLSNKVKSREDLEKQAKQIPVVGEIPRVEKKASEMILKNDRSVLAESFRILHTNLQYLLVNTADKQRGNTIFVTSTVKGEGKTLVSFNLAVTLANTNKRVLLVGADLRNPQLQRFEVDAREHIGVSDYLAKGDLKLKDLIRESNTGNPNLQLLPSGTIPPNPSELWRRNKTGEMFEELETMYDYVIVDTAPSLLVTDTFLINKWADLTLYVVRAGYTEKKLLQFAVDSKNDGKFSDLSFVLNDVKWANFGYGNKYGYAYGEEKKSFLKWLTSKAAMF
ncbi:capsular exopolysaccharide synthesis family protein [Christiangramia gaetbulicola]|uniref:non-specific protein-tyrosine kinase n=1 Tax=Christiangramia gaetbulicola TaxID=703340 RepID=A0A2T6AKX7_9FLAO|nr:tyrosine-protein kinase family protein [Christiangramia gaetbulicola]PTX44472.1 capsular exopolysaccharide synthesis family protein [Christiangramia gaetbulicola]